jgi:hypothetical protein
MKKILLVLILLSNSFGSEMIGDFAPAKVGSVWEYSYSNYSSLPGPGYHQFDTFSVRIEVNSKKKIGKQDTLITLRISEKGRSSYILLPSVVDSTFQREFVDTVVFKNDSVFKAPGYRCIVFPFWRTHSISSDSLSKVLKNKDTVYQYNYNFGWGNSRFLENVGLIHYYCVTQFNPQSTININLLSFNDTLVAVGVKNTPKTVSTKIGTKPQVLIRTNHPYSISENSVLLNGKEMKTTNRLSNGVYLVPPRRNLVKK